MSRSSELEAIMHKTHWVLMDDYGAILSVHQQTWHFIEGADGAFYSKVDKRSTETRTFESMDAASVYAAVYGLAHQGFAPRCVVGNQVMGPKYHGWICESCGRSHEYRHAAVSCCASLRRRGA
jgi:hypothetical protein